MEAAHAVSLSGLSGAHMRLKLIVALLLVALYHFGNRTAAGGAREAELPSAVRTRPATETVLFNPDQLAYANATWDAHVSEA
jgi:hypothetical protein